MVDKLIVRAIYEDGVFKPLNPLDLPDKKVVEFELEIEAGTHEPADFEGALAPYWQKLSYEEMDES